MVHPAFEVGEPPLDGILTYTATADFVGDEDECGILGSEFVEFFFQTFKSVIYSWLFPFCLFTREEEAGALKSDAVDDNNSS